MPPQASYCIACDRGYVFGYVTRDGGLTNWEGSTLREVLEFPEWVDGFGTNGYYFHWAAYAARELRADGWFGGSVHYEGYKLKPAQGPYYIRVDIPTYRQ
jgi:hypothetical protein